MSNLQSTAPIVSAEAITAHDDNDITVTRSILVTAAGNISVIFQDDSSAVTIPVNANTVYPFCVTRIRSTDTTATGIIALR